MTRVRSGCSQNTLAKTNRYMRKKSAKNICLTWQNTYPVSRMKKQKPRNNDLYLRQLPKTQHIFELEYFQDALGHWNPKTTTKCVSDRFWWTSMVRDVKSFVCS